MSLGKGLFYWVKQSGRKDMNNGPRGPRWKLKALLMANNLSQRELSARTGINEGYISYFIRGRLNLDEKQLNKIASVLNVSAQDVDG